MTWSLLSGSPRGSSGPGPRHGHCASVYQSCMYIFGGVKGLREQRDFWKWNPSSHMWTSIKNKSGPPRLMGHSATTYKDSMLVFGGGESQNSPNHCLWRYSFTTQTWTQVATLPSSTPPDKIHHCCIGLGLSYRSDSPGPGPLPGPLDRKPKAFHNKCFPAPLTFLDSEGAIELETFSTDKSYANKTRSSEPSLRNDPQLIGSCLTFENKGFKKQLSVTEELMDEDEDITNHLPDLMLVLGGRPHARHRPISTWQVTLTDA